MPLAQGTNLGRYQIRELLGEGGMGEVYLAEDLSLHRHVAIKVLRNDLTEDEDRLRRFEREARAASSLNHPNILTIYGIENDEQHHFIATEFVDGLSLQQYSRDKPLKPEEVLGIGIQVASALSAAHAAGIVHRDIKPDNIMLRRDGLVKVLDFGLAKLNETATSPETAGDEPGNDTQSLFLTVPGLLLGTPRYMSPEQARCQPVDERTDVFSLGAVLYKIAAGKQPFTGDTVSDILVSVLSDDPKSLTEIASGVPVEMDRIVRKALHKDREQRYQKMSEMEQDLTSLKERWEFEKQFGHADAPSTSGYTTRQTGVPPPALTARFFGKLKQHKLAALVLLGLVVAGTMAGGYLVYRGGAGSSNGRITSLAVLPFQNLSNDPEKDYLSDGISESLINRLSQLSGVKVIANTSSARYKGKEANPGEIARALGIMGVLTGKVSQQGQQLSISVELIDARDNTHVWGERYRRNITDVVAIQSEISREITDKLRVRLTPGQERELSARDRMSPEAYDLLLKGYSSRAKGTSEDRKKAGEYFKQASEADPRCAIAFAELSDIYRSLIGSNLVDPVEYLPKARAAAEKALELDQGLAEGHYALANLMTYAWEWGDAEKQYRMAIEKNPNLALAHRWYASYLRLVSRHEQAIEEIKRASELDPLSPGVSSTVGFILFNARRYDEAVESLNQTLKQDPNFPYTHLFLGFVSAARQQYAEAIGEYQKAMTLGLDTPATRIYLAAAYAQSGDKGRAQEILSRLQSGKESVSPGQLAILYAALGEKERAFASLDKAFAARDPQLQSLGVEPGFDPLRSDPRFKDLLRRVGL